MYIKDTEITLSWVLEANALFPVQTGNTYDEAYFDLQITLPSGTVVYLEGVNGAGWATVATPGSPTEDALITYAYTPAESGVHTLILSTGTSASFTILDKANILVVDTTTTKSNTLILP